MSGLALSLLLPVFFQRPAVASEAPVPEFWDARITDIHGEAAVFEKKRASDGLPAAKGLPLEEGDTVATGKNSSVEIALEGTGVILLRESSTLTISSAAHADASFALSLGTFLAKFQKLMLGQDLKVCTPAAVAAIRGTEFGVAIPPENPNETRVAVFEDGMVEVRGLSGVPEFLNDDQETSVRMGEAPLPASPHRNFLGCRLQVRSLRDRLKSLAKQWKPLSVAERSKLRESLTQEMLHRRLELNEERRKAQGSQERRK